MSEPSLLEQIDAAESLLRTVPDDLNPIGTLVDILSTSLDFTATIKPHALKGKLKRESRSKNIHSAAYALHRAFSSLIRRGRLHGRVISTLSDVEATSSDTTSVEVVRVWLSDRYKEYLQLLFKLLILNDDVLPEPTEVAGLRLDGLSVLMALVRTESEVLAQLTIESSKYKWWPDDTFCYVVKGVVRDDVMTAMELRSEWILRYMGQFDDVRFHFLTVAARLCSTTTTNQSKSTTFQTANLLSILENVTSMPSSSSDISHFWGVKPTSPNHSSKRKSGSSKRQKRKKARLVVSDGSTGIFDSSSEEEESGDNTAAVCLKNGPSVLLLSAHRKAFSQAWKSLLTSNLPIDQTKKVLGCMHRVVLPHLGESGIGSAMDFLVDCTDLGGTIAILALDGLWTLISKHNLDYPGFFEKLYGLLDNQVLHVRYRARFFRMLETFLSSPMLPVNLVASFVKRLARLSLCAPPAAIISVIPFVYNLLKKHPSCMVMLHRDGWPNGLSSDPYNEKEIDPLTTKALESSLWELSNLRSHSLASVATLAKIFAEAFDKPGYNMEDFLDHSYATVAFLFSTEVKRKVKRDPALSVMASGAEEESSLFTCTSEMAEGGDIFNQMWVF